MGNTSVSFVFCLHQGESVPGEPGVRGLAGFPGRKVICLLVVQKQQLELGFTGLGWTNPSPTQASDTQWCIITFLKCCLMMQRSFYLLCQGDKGLPGVKGGPGYSVSKSTKTKSKVKWLKRKHNSFFYLFVFVYQGTRGLRGSRGEKVLYLYLIFHN